MAYEMAYEISGLARIFQPFRREALVANIAESNPFVARAFCGKACEIRYRRRIFYMMKVLWLTSHE